jgi:hypothetical protein
MMMTAQAHDDMATAMETSVAIAVELEPGLALPVHTRMTPSFCFA